MARPIGNRRAGSMKWFFALNEKSPAFGDYSGMIRAAVHSARTRTRLSPCFLFDGEPCALTAWLEANGVTVLRRRWRLLDEFNRVAGESGRTQLLGFAGGIFLRMEIPRLCEEMGWGDEQVLYTDCDILFTGDPEPLFPDLDGAYFGVGPEFDPNNVEDMNSGVMVMRLPAMRAVEGAFEQFVRETMADCARYTDQFAYKAFFRHGWKGLPPELNWKPYWGENPAARIIHFHAAKPFLRPILAGGGGTPDQRRYARGAYEHYCRLWDAEYAATLPAC
jgi:hypothetical protein